MSGDLHALLAHARTMSADARGRLAAEAVESRPEGTVLLTTCHRVELYGRRSAVEKMRASGPWRAAEARSGRDVARHLLRLAVGRDSAVVGEDQVLHQLRSAVQTARASGTVPPELDRLLDVALRAGRRARSWLPARRPNLAEIALRGAVGGGDAPPGPVLVVGSGEMGRLAAAAVVARGGNVLLASRTPERALALAEQLSAAAVDFEVPAATLAEADGVIIALAGRWPLATAARDVLAGGRSWVIDLSSPPALDRELRGRLGERLTTIDELVDPSDAGHSQRLLRRLDALADEAVAEYEQWSARVADRSAAAALRRRAAGVESTELEELWQRVPGLSVVERDEVARAVRRITNGLLRDPFERLGEDGDGRHARAAQELFRL